MVRPFNGKVEIDIRNSDQDWSAFTQPSPPEGSPNVVVLLWDDTGIATWDFYGGLVEMPNMKRIADKGLRYTQFHITALCSPTRASLLTGRNPSSVGMNTISEATMGAGHAPHHVPKEWADKYKGVFDMGYEQYAEQTFQRMKQMGIIPESTDLAPMNSMVDATNSDGVPWPDRPRVAVGHARRRP